MSLLMNQPYELGVKSVNISICSFVTVPVSSFVYPNMVTMYVPFWVAVYVYILFVCTLFGVPEDVTMLLVVPGPGITPGPVIPIYVLSVPLLLDNTAEVLDIITISNPAFARIERATITEGMDAILIPDSVIANA